MIPKKIHYIWLGGKPFPKMVKKCIKSWQKYCPDYEIIRWDESNLNLDICPYVRQAYDSKKYAFASDVLRFYVLKEHGGIYLDVDVELLKPLDELLNNKAFSGFEYGNELFINPGLVCGAEKNNPVVTDFFNMYLNDTFIKKNGELNLETVCLKVTKHLSKNYGLKIKNEFQDLNDIVIYPTQYFCPLNASTKKVECLTDKTISKHLYLSSWARPTFREKVKKFIKKIIGQKNATKLKNKFSKGK